MIVDKAIIVDLLCATLILVAFYVLAWWIGGLVADRLWGKLR